MRPRSWEVGAESGVAIRVEVLDRDWKTLRRTLRYQVPVAVFVVALGSAGFSWRFASIAVAVLAITWVLLVVIQRIGIRRGRLPGAAYVLRASIARRPGRLGLDQRDLSWWPYKARNGDPELAVPWSGVDHITIQPVAEMSAPGIRSGDSRR